MYAMAGVTKDAGLACLSEGADSVLFLRLRRRSPVGDAAPGLLNLRLVQHVPDGGFSKSSPEGMLAGRWAMMTVDDVSSPLPSAALSAHAMGGTTSSPTSQLMGSSNPESLRSF